MSSYSQEGGVFPPVLFPDVSAVYPFHPERVLFVGNGPNKLGDGGLVPGFEVLNPRTAIFLGFARCGPGNVGDPRGVDFSAPKIISAYRGKFIQYFLGEQEDGGPIVKHTKDDAIYEHGSTRERKIFGGPNMYTCGYFLH